MSHQENEIFTTTLEDVQATAKEFGRIVVDLPAYGRIIVLDDHIIGEGFVKQFERNPSGFMQARRWAVRMDDADEESSMSFDQLHQDHLKEMN